jgi:phage-related baseplate assembly protein
MIPIESLVTPITADQLTEIVFDALEAAKIPARSWRPGGVSRSILGVLISFAAMAATLLTSLISGMFLAFARGDYLTAHAEDVYGVKRIPATFASAALGVTFTNAGGTPRTVNPNELVVRSSNTGARFRVTGVSGAAFVIPANGSISADVTAIEAGSASSVSPAEIDTLETTIAKVSVTNAGSITGADAESDDALVARCLAERGTWSPFGPRDAYIAAVLSSKLIDGTPTSINRVNVSRFSSIGKVTIVCATPSGTPTSDELAAALDAVEARAKPDTVTVELDGAVPHDTTHSIIVWCRGGAEPIIRLRAQSALAKFIANYPIGGIVKAGVTPGKLWADAIGAVIIGSSPEVFDVDFDGGEVDISLAANEVAVDVTTFDVRIQ